MKTILITGSTDGIGKLTAIKLASLGHNIYIHGRNKEKLEKTINQIKNESGNTNIDGFLADFSDLNSVTDMVNSIKTKIPKIDILINNAGIYNSKIPDNKNGLDNRIVVNYLATYLFTHLLLEKYNPKRIINLSSAAQASLNIETLKGNIKESENSTYAQSKLALTMWSFYLAKKLKNTSVIAVNPGSLLNTKMAKEAFGQIWSPAEKGVEILTDLSLNEKYIGVTGKYFDNDLGTFSNAHKDSYDNEKIKNLIQETKKIINN